MAELPKPNPPRPPPPPETPFRESTVPGRHRTDDGGGKVTPSVPHPVQPPPRQTR